ALAEARPHPLDHGPLAAEPELSALCEVRRVPKPEDVAPGAKPASARELEAQRALLAPEEGGRHGSGDPVAHHGDRLRAGQRLEVPLHAIELERLERAAANPELDRVLYRRTPVGHHLDDGCVPTHPGYRPGGVGRRRPAQQRERSEQANPEASHMRLLRTPPYLGGPSSPDPRERVGHGDEAGCSVSLASITMSAPASLIVPAGILVRPWSRTPSPEGSARTVETRGVRPPCGNFERSAESSAGAAFPANGSQRKSSGSVQNDPDQLLVERRACSSGSCPRVFGAAPRASTTVSSATRSSAASARTVRSPSGTTTSVSLAGLPGAFRSGFGVAFSLTGAPGRSFHTASTSVAGTSMVYTVARASNGAARAIRLRIFGTMVASRPCRSFSHARNARSPS